jgi:hypothetical protein
MKLNKSIKTTLSLAAAMGSLALAGSANAAFVAPVGATASSFYAGTGSDIRDPSGAIGTVGIVSGSGATAMHNNVNADNWLTNGVSVDEWISFDLGQAYDLNAIYLWNYNENHSSGEGRDIKDFTVEVSANGSTWVAPSSGGSQTAAEVLEATTPHGAETLAMTASNVQYVRFTIDSLHKTQAYGGLAHVGFEGTAVPEPSTTALLGLGGLALILRRRK